MAKRPVKFIWGSSRRIRGDWHLGLWSFYDRRPGLRDSAIAISCRGLLGWAAGAAAGLYLLAAGALFYSLQRNPYNQVSLTDTLLLPVRWHRVAVARGRMMIEEGLADLKAKRWAEAAMKLRAGLGHAPHDLRARLALAQFYTLANRRPAALSVLTEELASGYPGRQYLGALFALAAEGEDFDVIVTACDRFIGTEPADRTWLTAEKLQALIHGGRAAEALRLAESRGEDGGDGLNEGRVLALLELRRPAAALSFLDRWQRQPTAQPAQVLRLQARAFREAGRLAEMDDALDKFRRLSPVDPAAYVYGVVQRSLAGQTAAASAALGDYFRRFSGSAENLLLMATALAEADATDLVRRCVDEAAAHGFPAKPFQSVRLQAQLAAGDWAGAGRTLAGLEALTKRPEPVEKFVFEWLTRLLTVAAQPEDGPRTELVEFLQQRSISMHIYRQTAGVLVRAGRFAAARQVLELAERAYPRSPTLAKLRAQVDRALRPPVAASSAALPVPGPPTALAFFEQLDAAARAQRWSEAAQSIRVIRVAKPVWLEPHEAEVLDWQMRVAAHTGDLLELLGAAKLFLDGSNDRAFRVVERARELGAAGNRPDGERLLQEVLRKNRDFPPALRLKQAWQPKPPAEK